MTGRIKVLLVDDEDRFIHTSKILLERRGFLVETATSGEEGLEILSRRPIDVVVLDLMMPGIGGIKTMHEIKRNHPGVEVILLSGNPSPEAMGEVMSAGAYDYLIKPCDIMTLVSMINAAYSKKTRTDGDSMKSVLDSIASSPLAVLDLKDKKGKGN